MLKRKDPNGTVMPSQGVRIISFRLDLRTTTLDTELVATDWMSARVDASRNSDCCHAM